MGKGGPASRKLGVEWQDDEMAILHTWVKRRSTVHEPPEERVEQRRAAMAELSRLAAALDACSRVRPAAWKMSVLMPCGP